MLMIADGLSKAVNIFFQLGKHHYPVIVFT